MSTDAARTPGGPAASAAEPDASSDTVADTAVDAAAGLAAGAEGGTGATPWCAIIINPAKAGDSLHDVQRLVAAMSEEAGWAPPTLWRTTPGDAGAGQAREAVGAGASLVVAAGGDGTTRAVAGVLAGSGVPLGLLPMGTGNLLARNLQIPLDDAAAAIETIIHGVTRPIDLCRVRVTRPDGSSVDEASVVMLGMGFDAEVMDAVDERLKSRMGWVAYFASGLPRLRGRRLRVAIGIDGARPEEVTVRSVLVATAGTLTAGITLLPQAEIDDGVADVALLDPRGFTGWPSLLWWVMTGARGSHAMLRTRRARRVRIEPASPASAQIDGDAVGEAAALEVHVEAAALLVRTPRRA